MKTTLWLGTMSLLASLLGLAGCYAHQHAQEPTDGDADVDVDADVDSDVDGDSDGDANYVVHEWGVFSGGEVHAGPGRWGGMMADKPILYFYADEPIEVSVGVDFPDGHARETWPELELGPTIAWNNVQVSDRPCTSHTPFPELGEGQCEGRWEWFCEATELPEYVVEDAGCLVTGGVTSPLLFYAGDLGGAPMPLEGSFCQNEPTPLPVEPAEPGTVSAELRNSSTALGPAFLIYRNLIGECEPWGGCRIDHAVVGTMWLEGIGAESTASVTINTELISATEGGSVMPPEWLMAEEDSLTTLLTDAGLTGDEAEALLDGWRHTFLDLMPDDNMISVPMGESLAIVYLLPQETFDELLPIRIEPAPREIVRVGLGHQYLEQACYFDS